MIGRSQNRTANEVSDAHQNRGGLTPRFECSSRTSYGAPRDLVTVFRKKIFLSRVGRPVHVLTPATAEYFIARLRAVPGNIRSETFTLHERNLIALHNEACFPPVSIQRGAGMTKRSSGAARASARPIRSRLPDGLRHSQIAGPAKQRRGLRSRAT